MLRHDQSQAAGFRNAEKSHVFQPFHDMLPAVTVTSDAALLRLLGLLEARGYAFVTPTPASHARVVARPGRAIARSVEDVLGWSLPFEPGSLPADIEACLHEADAVRNGRSTLRVSRLGGELYLHSAYPTEDKDSVFFGPDSYRFAALIEAEILAAGLSPEARVVDIGTGAGVGAITAARLAPRARVTMTDINRTALRLARINARAAGVAIRAEQCDGFDKIDGPLDLILVNPPYIIDEAGRTYRDGGGMHGASIALDLAREAMALLAPGGRLVLYTGSAIVDGKDRLRSALARAAVERNVGLSYRELDPDVFGEELDKPAYSDVDRIALVAAIAKRGAG